VKGKDVFPLPCRLDRLLQKLCYACLPSGIFQWVKGLNDSIVLVAIMKPYLKSNWSTFHCLHNMTVAALCCTY